MRIFIYSEVWCEYRPPFGAKRRGLYDKRVVGTYYACIDRCGTGILTDGGSWRRHQMKDWSWHRRLLAETCRTIGKIPNWAKRKYGRIWWGAKMAWWRNKNTTLDILRGLGICGEDVEPTDEFKKKIRWTVIHTLEGDVKIRSRYMREIGDYNNFQQIRILGSGDKKIELDHPLGFFIFFDEKNRIYRAHTMSFHSDGKYIHADGSTYGLAIKNLSDKITEHCLRLWASIPLEVATQLSCSRLRSYEIDVLSGVYDSDSNSAEEDSLT